nr:nicotinate (nicotinamide) nucleotide adenylyltransferase [uncultured Treponema sp.]
MMKIAIFGGTFNPVHIGHIALADDVCRTLGYDKVLFVPTFIPPHKKMLHVESAENRVAMLKNTFKSDSRFVAETCEVDRGGVSYTIDTVHTLIEKYKGELDGKFGLIMGQENAFEFNKWKGASELAEITDIIIAQRQKAISVDTDGFENENTGEYTGGFNSSEYLKIFSQFPFNYIPLKNLILPVSSTEIRARIAKGAGWRYLVPQAVYDYIIENKLYGYNG